jgi:predicted O-methyltransferase YrrM
MSNLLETLVAVYGRLAARHKELSIIASPDDDPGRPNERLIDLALKAASRARSIDFADLDSRTSDEPRWYRLWPGDHYRLLAGLMAELQAKTVIEIGTFTGMGTLALAHALPPGGRIVTFDVVPWQNWRKTWLRADDFADGRIAQVIGDIATPGSIEPYRDIFSKADFVFVDGPKDGTTERGFMDALSSIQFRNNPIMLFDDIRLINMLEIWRKLDRPKFDITSFGHWSGSGLVDWMGQSEPVAI